MGRLAYLRRVLAAYVLGGRSQLTFWHETPAVNPRAKPGKLGEYWMTFRDKADYPGPFDERGVPLLDYRGTLGRQYNPIAIAQYGLANWNLWLETKEEGRRLKAVAVADWLVERLEANAHNRPVWMHHFDWDYRTPLKAPWYSALAQGQGISLLVRVPGEKYLSAAKRAVDVFHHPIADGGVIHVDAKGRTWLEEYLVDPPTHILNGFLWASWGLYDLWLATGDAGAKSVFDASMRTLREELGAYDTGWWSLYEQSGTRLRMVASPFYHKLHIVQLRIQAALTGDALYAETAERWEGYAKSGFKRRRAWLQKAVFKLLYY
jgi:hypothetical protein